MSFTDLHPEAILDRHLEGCETCRFERRVRKDFAQELADSELLPGGARLTELLIEAKVLGSHVSYRSVRARLGAGVAWLAAAAVICATGAAMGAGLAGPLLSRFEDAPSPKSSVLSSAPLSVRASPPSEEAPVPVPDLHADAPHPVLPSAPVPAQARATPPIAQPTAASLFEKESGARRQGDYVGALSFHHELEAHFGLSREAQVSRAVVGRGLLDRGRADDALACFDDYLAFGSGDLGEEVMAGRATALERLDRSDDARAAWQRLRKVYPTTSYASRTTPRLENSL
jgi:hypothetical protein